MAQAAALSNGDVLYHIFLDTLPSHIVAQAEHIDTWVISPINLSLVCRSWYAVVSSRPALWSSFFVEDIDLPWIPHMIARWLRNALSYPSLNITIKITSSASQKDLKEIWDLISPHHHRLNELKIKKTSYIGHNAGRITIPFSSSMTSLVLKNILGTLDITSAFNNSQLRVLDLGHSVDGFVRWLLPEQRAISFPLLNELGFSAGISNNPKDVYGLLSACPNIEELDILVRPSSIPASASTIFSQLTFSRLTRLALVSENNIFLSILDWLKCPSLSTFSLDVEVEDGNTVTPAVLSRITNFFVRSQAPLRSLRLGFVRSTATFPTATDERSQALESMLRGLDGIVDLHLYGVIIDNQLIKILTLEDTAPICPKLSYIHVGCADDEVQIGTIEDMIESRTISHKGALRSISVGIYGIGNVGQVSERIRACIAKGLRYSHNKS